MTDSFRICFCLVYILYFLLALSWHWLMEIRNIQSSRFDLNEHNLKVTELTFPEPSYVLYTYLF